ALEIGCAYEWRLALASGESLVVTTRDQKPGATVEAEAQWSKSGAALGKARERVSGNAFEGFNFERQESQSEAMGQVQAMQSAMTSPEYAALQQRQNTAMGRMTECTKKAQAEMGACLKAVT